MIFAEGIDVAGDKSDRIIDFVGHTCGKLTDGSHFFGVQNLSLGRFEILVILLQCGQGLLAFGGIDHRNNGSPFDVGCRIDIWIKIEYKPEGASIMLKFDFG